MNLRNYNNDDFDQVLDLFNKNSEYDQMTAALMTEKINGDPFFEQETTFVTIKDDNIIGFMQGVQRDLPGERVGYIKLMVVDKGFRRQGIARSMYKKIETIFKDRKMDKMRIYDTPFNYWMPGIDPRYTAALCFAWRLGFERFRDTTNMQVALQEQDWVTETKEKRQKTKEGILIKRAGEADKGSLLDFIDEHFALWRREIETSYKNIPVSNHIAIHKGKVKAFSAHNTNNFGTGWFGPMGTHPDLRGRGIGEILLKRCLQDMKNEGLEYSTIPWVAPIAFYSHYCNAVVERVFWRFEKSLA